MIFFWCELYRLAGFLSGWLCAGSSRCPDIGPKPRRETPWRHDEAASSASGPEHDPLGEAWLASVRDGIAFKSLEVKDHF